MLTVAPLGEETIASLSLRAAREWRPGTRGVDDGILATLAMKKRRVRIGLGTIFGRYIGDAGAREIIDREMTPAFATGDLAGRLQRGLERLMEEA